MKPRLGTPVVNAALFGVALVTTFPLLWMVSVSLMASGEASAIPPPLRDSSAAAAGACVVRQLSRALRARRAVALPRQQRFPGHHGYPRFAGRDRIFRILLGALVIPGQVAMVPLFLLLKQLGLVNSYGGVIVPALASIFGIFLVRQYALSIPNELLEAARIDGASELRIFVSVVLPALKPIIVTLAVFTLLGTWNDFMWPLIVLTDKDLYTLPVALAALSREHVQDDELMMAGSVVTILPVLLVFLSLQRYYLQGLLAGSVKG